MTQPEALRLADRLRDGWGLELRREAEAELRRLHADLERCKQVCAATSECWRKDAEKLEAQRDALLDALHSISLAAQDSGSTREGMGLYARAAIAKCEENT